MKRLSIILLIVLVSIYAASVAISMDKDPITPSAAVNNFADSEQSGTSNVEAVSGFADNSTPTSVIPSSLPAPVVTEPPSSSPVSSPAQPSPSASPSPSPTPTPDPITQAITLAVGGDVLPEGNSGQIGQLVRQERYTEVLDEVTAERFRAADLTIINLESSVSERGSPLDKAYTFRSAPETLSLLTDWLGADVVSLANNHTVDYGWDAFDDTMLYLREAGIGYTGAGADISEAAAPYVAEIRGVSIAVFAANQIMTFSDWPATESKHGMMIARDPANLGTLGENIQKASELYDYVIVYMHWGIERDTIPYERQTNTAKALIDAGADLVLGSHPHVVQTFDYYNGKPIVYSVGNFIFNSRCPETCALYITLQNGEITIEISPLKISNTLTYIPDEETAAAMLKTWGDRSKNINIVDGVIVPIADT